MKTVLKNCRIVDPICGMLRNGDIVIENGIICHLTAVGAGQGEQIIDCKGKYACAGFQDAHFHSESTMLSLAALAEILIRRGTTSIYINPHEVANVAGLEGVRALLDQAEALPLRVFLVAPCKVPTAPSIESSGAFFGQDELLEMLSWDSTVGIGEIDAHKLLRPREPYTTFIQTALQRGLTVCGSINGFRGESLQTCFAAGITDDHESVSGEEALEKMQYGAYLHLREGSTEQNLEEILTVLKEYPACLPRVCFCCDDKTPSDLVAVGHIDNNIRKAICLGIDPVTAIGMATFNTANYYGKTDRFGLLAPGRCADIVLMDDLSDVHVTDVFIGGEHILIDGEMQWSAPDAPPLPENARHTIHVHRKLSAEEMYISYEKNDVAVVRTVRITPGQITTKICEEQLPVIDGTIRVDVNRDIQHFALVDRYQGNGDVIAAFVQGFGIRRGAFATSVSHDHHHLVCVGTNPEDMAFALNRVISLGGGMVVVDREEVVAELPLPLWGLLSTLTAEETIAAEQRVNRAVRALGCSFADRISPLAVLSLMSLPVIGEAGFSNRGLVDVKLQQIIPVIVK